MCTKQVSVFYTNVTMLLLSPIMNPKQFTVDSKAYVK